MLENTLMEMKIPFTQLFHKKLSLSLMYSSSFGVTKPVKILAVKTVTHLSNLERR